MTAYDSWLAGYRSHPVRVVCVDCGEEWDGLSVSEYGTGWLEPHEECPKCGSDALDAADLDETDIEERRLESRGEDF